MLVTGYNQKRDNVIKSVEKYLAKLEKQDVISDYIIEEFGGMGSYETFYITFELPETSEDGYSYSICLKLKLWNDDYKTVTELKKAVYDCIMKAKVN